jgi:hypothetical protein
MENKKEEPKKEEVEENIPPPPKVFKVKDPPPSKMFKGLHPHLPQPPSLLLIIGSVRSGKSNLLCNLLCNPSMFKDRFDVVHLISNTLNADPKMKMMKKYFACQDHYQDSMIENIIESQKSLGEDDRLNLAVCLDDILTKDFSKNNYVSFLATRFRHYGINLLCFTTQSFRAVSGLIRNNSTNVIICKQQNAKELEKIAEEYGDLFGSPDIFKKIYNIAHKDRYSFLHLDLQTNPATAYYQFERVIARGSEILE